MALLKPPAHRRERPRGGGGRRAVAAPADLTAAARADSADLLRTLRTSEAGLPSGDAAARLERFGPSEVTRRPRRAARCEEAGST
jgi:hypothetical protein